MDKGNTARVLGSFLDGMRDAGADVELLYTGRMKLKPCACGEMYCWSRKPGECCVADDMQSVYPKLAASDTVVLATPVYIPLPGAMQDFINRLCPLLEPRLSLREGRTRARLREGVRIRRFVALVTGGWWEKENLDTVVRIVKELAEDASVEFSGAVLRPHASVMRKKGELTEEGKAVLDAARRAGQELVRHGAMRKETLEAVSRPLITEEELRRRYNS
jgi:multimeric flavodoxin WrbA